MVRRTVDRLGRRTVDRLAELIPRVTRETIDGAAHVPHLTNPERYIDVKRRAVLQHVTARGRNALVL